MQVNDIIVAPLNTNVTYNENQEPIRANALNIIAAETNNEILPEIHSYRASTADPIVE